MNHRPAPIFLSGLEDLTGGRDTDARFSFLRW
jgi:hypothetical protein